MRIGKLYILITIVITLYLLAACFRGGNTEIHKLNLPPERIRTNLDQAEQLYRARNIDGNLQEAVRLLSQVRDPDARNFEVEWKFSKFSYFLGKKLTDDAEREKTFEAGKSAGQIAMRLQPDKPDGYFWYAANQGELARMSPITVGLRSVDDIREAMNKVIELQPDYQGASAYDALAQVELGSRLTGGKASKAVEYLEKAITIEQHNSNLQLHLAQAYLAAKQKDKARKQLETVISMTPNPDFVAEHEANVAEARRLLASRF